MPPADLAFWLRTPGEGEIRPVELPAPGPVTAQCQKVWAEREADNVDP